MSEYYKITEIAKLYGVCADTLRYYEEQGILHPRRGENNYRMYGIQDICNLNIIQSLRSLDMPVSKIREYMATRTVSSTLALLDEETALIDRRIAELIALRRTVRQREAEIRAARALPVGECRLVNLAPRTCYVLSMGVTLEEDVDFLLKRLEKKHEDQLQNVAAWQMGATLDGEYLEQGVYNQFANAFIVCDEIEDYDYILPGGRYASIVYRGRYENLSRMLPALLEYVEGEGLEAAAPPVELYHIDVHDTGLREEYLTEVQIHTKTKTKK